MRRRAREKSQSKGVERRLLEKNSERKESFAHVGYKTK